MKKVITEAYIADLLKDGIFELDISDGAIITPLAKDKIKAAGIKIISNRYKSRGFGATLDYNNVILAYKSLSPHLLDKTRELFFNIRRLQTFKIRRNFPESLVELIKQISLGESELIIILTDEPEETLVFANKFPRARAICGYDEMQLKRAKEKLNPNIIVFDSTLLSETKIEHLLHLFKTGNSDREAVAKTNEQIFNIEKYFINRA